MAADAEAPSPLKVQRGSGSGHQHVGVGMKSQDEEGSIRVGARLFPDVFEDPDNLKLICKKGCPHRPRTHSKSEDRIRRCSESISPSLKAGVQRN